jgi:hypothetical protein
MVTAQRQDATSPGCCAQAGRADCARCAAALRVHVQAVIDRTQAAADEIVTT